MTAVQPLAPAELPAAGDGPQLKALGNGVVPQQGAAALAHLIARIELEVT